MDKGFNGAVTLSLQKCDKPILWKEEIALLQWGCNFIVTEISDDTQESVDIVSASMGL